MMLDRGGRISWAAGVGLAVLAALVGLTLTGCGRASQQPDPAPEVSMSLSVSPDPPLFGRPCEMRITLLDGEGRAIDGAELSIKGDMTHAGMVPVLTEIKQSENGVYATDFAWSMGGDWIVTVSATLPDGRVTSRQFELTVEMPGG